MVHKIKLTKAKKKGILYFQVGLDFEDYAENIADEPSDIKRHRKLAKEAFGKAKKFGITEKNVDKFYLKLPEDEKEALAQLHPTEIKSWAKTL